MIMRGAAWMRGPSPVMARVCSAWAARLPSVLRKTGVGIVLCASVPLVRNRGRRSARADQPTGPEPVDKNAYGLGKTATIRLIIGLDTPNHLVAGQ
jgi:hypothetical protein